MRGALEAAIQAAVIASSTRGGNPESSKPLSLRVVSTRQSRPLSLRGEYRRGNPESSKPLSLRGAQRRGNPKPMSLRGEYRRGNPGHPNHCHCEEHSDTVIARSIATLSLRGAQRHCQCSSQ